MPSRPRIRRNFAAAPAHSTTVGRLILLAAGKARLDDRGRRAALSQQRFPAERLSGIAVARHGYGRPLQAIEMIEAGHPVPDQAGLDAAARTLKTRRRSGRRSRAGADVGRRLGQLDRAGAGLVARGEAGGDARAAALRRHYRRDQHGAQASLAHQGRTARACAPLRRGSSRSAISDVPGDDPAVIGSGPTVPDPTTLADARAIVARFRLDLPDGVAARAQRSGERNAEAGDPVFRQRAISSRRAARRCVRGRARRSARRRLRMHLPRRPPRRRGARGRGRAGAAGARPRRRRAGAP